MSEIKTEQSEINPQEIENVAVLPGALLRQKRESLGWSQKDIADRLRLRVVVIENIENDSVKSDQVATFTRGYLRSYAKLVGIEEDEVLALFDGAQQESDDVQSMQSFSRKTKREKHDSRIMLLTWGIMLTLVGISSVWWWQNQEQDTLSVTELQAATAADSVDEPIALDSAALDSPVVEVAVSDAEPTLLPLEEETSAVVAEENTPVIEDTAPVETPVAEPVQETPAEASVPDVAANLLEMSFRSDCWILVKDATGKTLSTGVKKAGQSLSLQGELPYSLVLGAPEGVTMTLADEAVDLSGYTAGKVAKFKLP
ncbi:cytoskeleton protein RodZ [Vibrio sp. SCSIO 43136]|uniref:cytoskeleton protein RodZ n=1 Tax=Vibrio sp. SCSIO 43136 TaxID=2819101 RepID=UPI002074BD07|nr:cytoskeleton protein RodZ [Vibrio sp. SCSIO 43136]USD65798.1 cytoskeleton protein RodZ [Vibrio sp. SCSIO 43136]